MTRSAAQVRQEFIDFFCRKHGHEFVPSAPVVPHDDPTLLFTNAGMNQFKPFFLGTEKPRRPRAANTQKCIRAGGKHNDLDDVGHDTYHHTFFEMLGNWSFGDYFKREAIGWAWELLTDVWGLDKTRLHATYFEGSPDEGLQPDLEAKELWASVTDIDPAHIHPGSKKDNFWEMGETGPCGPCSEIHIDLTPDKSGIKLVNAGDARVIEIWNLVFIQFDRAPDGTLSPLPARHVDTGMGFERVTALLQGKSSNYDTDIFTPIFAAIREVTGAPPYEGTLPDPNRDRERAADRDPNRDRERAADRDPNRDRERAVDRDPNRDREGAERRQLMIDTSYRVIADHIRCLAFALTDDAVPDREGRGYVLRSILRRAVFYGRQYLNMHGPFQFRLVPTVVDVMADAFTELRTAHGGKNVEYVAELIREEEESFYRTLDRGITLFEEASARAFVGSASAHQMSLGGKRHLIDIETGTFSHTLPSPQADKFYVNASTRFTVYKLPDQPVDTFTGSEISARHVAKYCGAPPVVSGEDAFRLHGTYGFPIDLTQIMAEEKGLEVDIAEYERLMEDARERARGATKTPHPVAVADVSAYGPTELVRTVEPLKARVSAILIGSDLGVDAVMAHEGEDAVLILDRTPFYAEKGGQVGDAGTIVRDDALFEVTDTQWKGDVVLHYGSCHKGVFYSEHHLRGKADVDRDVSVTATLATTARRATMKNHTATHVMNWALREVLGDHVQQKGSLVDPEKTRFDFSHPKPLMLEEIERVEQLVNERIRENLPVHTEYKPTDEARNINGLRAVFGEKYPDPVRIVACGVPIGTLVQSPDNPEWSRYPIELCGGTHCKSTGEIEHFAITSEEAVAKGIRRVVGITGEAAEAAERRGQELLARADALLTTDAAAGAAPGEGAPPLPGMGDGRPLDAKQFAGAVADLQKAVSEAVIPVGMRVRLRERFSELQQIIKRQQKARAADAADVVNVRIDKLLRSPEKIGDTTVVVAELPDLPLAQLKSGADRIKQKCGSAAVLFGVHVRADPNRDRERAAPDPNRDRERAAPDQNRARKEAAPDPNRDRERAATPPGKALLLAAMTNDLVKRGLKAGDLVKHVAPIVKGGGGGPPTMAQAGGKDPEKLGEALEAGRKWIQENL